MKKSTIGKIVPAAAGVLALGTAGVWAASRLFVRAAMDRDVPPLVLKLSEGGRRVHMGDPEGLQRDPADAARLEARPHEQVTIRAYDGERLAGHWYPAENPERIVVCVHGWRTTWSRDFGMMHDFLLENGCSVLFPEQRGQNASGGDGIGFGVTEQYDVPDWLEWLKERCGGDLPVYLYGISMGSATAILASALDLSLRISGIIADCGYTSPEAIWRSVTKDKLHLPFWLFRPFAEQMFRRRTGAGLADFSTIDVLRKTQIPVLFFHGGSDKFVPIGMSRANDEAAAGWHRLVSVPGAPHAMSYYVDPAKYESAVREFWSECETVRFIGQDH